MKTLLWLAVIGLVIGALYVKRTPRSSVSGKTGKRKFDSTGAEIMLRCVHCGVYLPASEALYDRDLVYCCQEHLGKPAIF